MVPDPALPRITWQSSASPALWCLTASPVKRGVALLSKCLSVQGMWCWMFPSLLCYCSALPLQDRVLCPQRIWRARGCCSLESSTSLPRELFRPSIDIFVLKSVREWDVLLATEISRCSLQVVEFVQGCRLSINTWKTFLCCSCCD